MKYIDCQIIRKIQYDKNDNLVSLFYFCFNDENSPYIFCKMPHDLFTTMVFHASVVLYTKNASHDSEIFSKIDVWYKLI